MISIKWILSVIIGLAIYYFINTNKFHSIVAKILLPLALILVCYIVLDNVMIFQEGFNTGDDDDDDNSDGDIIETVKSGGGGSSKGGGSKMMSLSKPTSAGAKTSSVKSTVTKSATAAKTKDKDDKDNKEKTTVLGLSDEDDDTQNNGLHIEDKDQSNMQRKELKVLKNIDKTLKANTSKPTTSNSQIKTETFTNYAPYNSADTIGTNLADCQSMDSCKLYSAIQQKLTTRQ